MIRDVALIAVLALSLLAAPLAAEAQASKVPRIGVLSPGTDRPGSSIFRVFQQGLRELGQIEGQNVALEIRSADGRSERLPDLAADLVRLQVDVILAISNSAIAAAQKATTSIPIVMVVTNEPVARGFVASLARPGGNITGVALQAPAAGKRLQLLKEAVPNLSRVAVLWDPGLLGAETTLRRAEAAAPALGLQLQLVATRSPAELDGAFAAMTRERAGAVFFVGSPLLLANFTRIAELAVKRRLPTMCGAREYVEAGCLMSYGASFTDQLRRAAYFVDKILKGARPADLPVEQPTKFELVINLKTAKALGLTIPQSVLGRADHIVE